MPLMHMGEQRYRSYHIQAHHKCRWVVNFTPQLLALQRREKSLAPARNQNTLSQSSNLWPSHYTDNALQAQLQALH